MVNPSTDPGWKVSRIVWLLCGWLQWHLVDLKSKRWLLWCVGLAVLLDQTFLCALWVLLPSTGAHSFLLFGRSAHHATVCLYGHRCRLRAGCHCSTLSAHSCQQPSLCTSVPLLHPAMPENVSAQIFPSTQYEFYNHSMCRKYLSTAINNMRV